MRQKCPNTEFFLIRIFPHSDQKKNPYLDTFQAVNGSVNIKFSTNSMSKFYRKEEYNKKFKVAAYVNN